MSIKPDQLRAVVLAGGFGTRVRHLLPGVPKPMAPVAEKPFLEWVVRYLAAQGVRKIVISTGYLSGVVSRHFEQNPVPGVEIRCVVEDSPHGTGGGFLHAARAAGGSPPAWLVLNGDSLVFADLASVTAAFDDPGAAGVIVGRSVPDASRYGTLATGPGGELLRFEEKRPGRAVINSGIYLLRHSLLAEFPDRMPLSFEQDVFPGWLARGMRIQTVVTDAPFLDIGTPETLPQAGQFIRDNQARFQTDSRH
jgi:D-glycero-alpha-D-manno-heptose 1-phosphate guanylyltransferase